MSPTKCRFWPRSEDKLLQRCTRRFQASECNLVVCLSPVSVLTKPGSKQEIVMFGNGHCRANSKVKRPLPAWIGCMLSGHGSLASG